MSTLNLTPTFNAKGFICPHCGVGAQMQWQKADFNYRDPRGTTYSDRESISVAICGLCEDFSLWLLTEDDIQRYIQVTSL